MSLDIVGWTEEKRLEIQAFVALSSSVGLMRCTIAMPLVMLDKLAIPRSPAPGLEVLNQETKQVSPGPEKATPYRFLFPYTDQRKFAVRRIYPHFVGKFAGLIIRVKPKNGGWGNTIF